MTEEKLLSAVRVTCAEVAAASRRASGADLDAPTPCRDFDLRRLVTHFLGTAGGFVRAGEDRELDPDDPWGSRQSLPEATWPAELADRVTALGSAWSAPEAWTGTIRNAHLPAQALGELGLVEVALHGWDLARAAGSDLTLPEAAGEQVLRAVAATAEQGRQYGIYGPEVSVAAGAPAFHRALGLSGRDPAWSG